MSAEWNPCQEAQDFRARLPTRLVSCAILVDADGRILVQTRPEGKSMAGLWEFPGGKIERLESAERALVRELAEEIGLETEESCLAPCGFSTSVEPEFHLLLLAFAIRKWRGQPAPKEGQQLRWVHPPELFQLRMPPADRPLLGQIMAIL